MAAARKVFLAEDLTKQSAATETLLDELVDKNQAETIQQSKICELQSQNKKLSARIAELEAFHSDSSGLAENQKLSDQVVELKSLLRTSTANFQKARSHIEALKVVINRLRRTPKPLSKPKSQTNTETCRDENQD